MNLGAWALYAALAIAFAKATLVALFFMHLLYDKRFNMIVFVGCLLFATIFISLALSDSLAYQSSTTPIELPTMHQPFGAGKS